MSTATESNPERILGWRKHGEYSDPPGIEQRVCIEDEERDINYSW